jgi:hypothetical protein
MRKNSLSVVVTARNDDHGRNFIYRMKLFIDGLISQFDRFDIDGEIIAVDWNPLTDKETLFQVFSKYSDEYKGRVRFITVGEELHKTLKHSESLPLYQMIAKNVGIVRASKEFVVTTNIDILFSDELILAITDDAEKGKYYRADRYDIPSDIPHGMTPQQKLAYCESHVLRKSEFGGTFSYFSGQRNYINPILTPEKQELEDQQDRGEIPVTTKKRLHTNACGDFTMMHIDDWMRITGYPELEIYSMHIDSLGIHLASSAGIEEVCLEHPCVTYHIEHGLGSGWSPEGENQLWDRLAKAGIGWLDHGDYTEMVIDMRRNGPEKYFNKSSWGFSDKELEEKVL